MIKSLKRMPNAEQMVITMLNPPPHILVQDNIYSGFCVCQNSQSPASAVSVQLCLCHAFLKDVMKTQVRLRCFVNGLKCLTRNKLAFSLGSQFDFFF